MNYKNFMRDFGFIVASKLGKVVHPIEDQEKIKFIMDDLYKKTEEGLLVKDLDQAIEAAMKAYGEVQKK